MRRLLLCEFQIAKSYEQLVELSSKYTFITSHILPYGRFCPKAVQVHTVKLQPRFVDSLPPLSPTTLECFFLDNSLHFILTKTLSQAPDQLQLLMSLRFCCLAVSSSLWEPQHGMCKDQKMLLRKHSKQSGFKLHSEGFCCMLLCLAFGMH